MLASSFKEVNARAIIKPLPVYYQNSWTYFQLLNIVIRFIWETLDLLVILLTWLLHHYLSAIYNVLLIHILVRRIRNQYISMKIRFVVRRHVSIYSPFNLCPSEINIYTFCLPWMLEHQPKEALITKIFQEIYLTLVSNNIGSNSLNIVYKMWRFVKFSLFSNFSLNQSIHFKISKNAHRFSLFLIGECIFIIVYCMLYVSTTPLEKHYTCRV